MVVHNFDKNPQYLWWILALNLKIHLSNIVDLSLMAQLVVVWKKIVYNWMIAVVAALIVAVVVARVVAVAAADMWNLLLVVLDFDLIVLKLNLRLN